MANVLLTSATTTHGRSGDADRDAYARLAESAACDPFGRHALTQDPAAADLILFAESWDADDRLTAVRRHPLVEAYREKCFVCCERDDAVHFLPGVYANVRTGEWLPRRVRQGFYLWMYENKFVAPAPFAEAKHLFSFTGALDTAGVRQRIGALRSHPRGHVRDTTQASNTVWGSGSAEEKAAFRQRYARDLQKSRFVLCPRGLSPSTVRLFDTLKTGRVPVVVADDWRPPEGPDWSACSVRVSEGEVAAIPERLERLEPRAEAMARAARRTWEQWFAPEVAFHRVVEWCRAIKETRVLPERLARLAAYAQLFRSRHVKNLLRPYRAAAPALLRAPVRTLRRLPFS